MAFELAAPAHTTTKRCSPTCRRRRSSIHHDKHHQAYVTNGNNLLKGSGLEDKSLEDVVKQSYSKNAGLFNNAGQHYNHIHLLEVDEEGRRRQVKLPGILAKAIDSDLGGYDKFRTDFIQAGVTPVRLGLGVGRGPRRQARRSRRRRTARTRSSTAARRSSASTCGSTPTTSTIATRRPKYLEAFVDNLINWDYVLELYEKAMSRGGG